MTASYYRWLMLIGMAVSLLLWRRLSRKNPKLLPVFFGGLLGAATGAKLIYLFAEGWADYGKEDMRLRWATGKTILGALIGGYGGVEWAKHLVLYKKPTGDLFARIVPIGVIIGRFGCLMEGCCLGAICQQTAWWTISDQQGIPRWPSVPVEILFNVIALCATIVLSRQNKLTGQHFHLYLIGYGAFRFIHEFRRSTPEMWAGLSGYQIAALFMVVFAVIRFRKRQNEIFQ
jgi:phosphatidylglycerol:prolipoprotein diacylglycerol transferase